MNEDGNEDGRAAPKARAAASQACCDYGMMRPSSASSAAWTVA
jgi:hypothetical protein